MTAVSVVTILGGRLRAIAYEKESRRLHDSAMTMVGLLDGSFDRNRHTNLTEAVAEIARENRTRVTLITDEGIVAEDS